MNFYKEFDGRYPLPFYHNNNLKDSKMRYFILISIVILFLLKIDAGFSMGKSPVLEHRITYSHKNTRSEARHGHLLINGYEIPDIFSLVIFQESVFKFYQRKQIWGMDGYFPVDKTAGISSIEESSADIGPDVMSKGWYEGKEKLAGTPADWLYVEWKEGAAFLSSEKIKNFASEHNLETIPRWETLPLRINEHR